MIRAIAITGVCLLLTLALTSPAFSVGLDTSGTGGQQPWSCSCPVLAQHSFSQSSHEYSFQLGKCQGGTETTAYNVSFNVKASWNVQAKTAGEVIEYSWSGKPAKVSLVASCPDDPWLHLTVSDTCTLKGPLDDPQGLAQSLLPGLSKPHIPKTRGCIPSSKLPALIAEAKAAPPVIVSPDSGHVYGQNEKIKIQVKAEPQAQVPSTNVVLEFQDPTGKITDRKVNFFLLHETGTQWEPGSLTPPGNWKVRARWDTEGGAWTSWRPFTLPVPVKTGFFPPPGQKDWEGANKYLGTIGCKHFLGRMNEYLCENDYSYSACETYLNDPKLGIKKCLRAHQ